MLFVLIALALGAAVATFLENDFGTAFARHYVYDALWYEALLCLASFNIALVLYRTKMFLHVSRFTFHFAFIVLLIGSGLTRYFGVDGVMKIRENSSANTLFSTELNDEIPLPFTVHLKDFEMER